jgi:putative transposase
MRDTGLGGEQAVVGRKSAAYSAFKHVSPSPDLGHAVAMPDYRRNRIPGATYFFTVNLLERGCDLLVVHIDALRDAVRKARTRSPFHIDAWVVLPDHMHCLWTLPKGDSDFPRRWRDIKTAFSKSLPASEKRSPIMIHRGERGIWQRRYWEHTIRDDRDYAAHTDYVHFNPVKHGLVDEPLEWPFSSLRRCVVSGLYPADRLGGLPEPPETGERA